MKGGVVMKRPMQPFYTARMKTVSHERRVNCPVTGYHRLELPEDVPAGTLLSLCYDQDFCEDYILLEWTTLEPMTPEEILIQDTKDAADREIKFHQDEIDRLKEQRDKL